MRFLDFVQGVGMRVKPRTRFQWTVLVCEILKIIEYETIGAKHVREFNAKSGKSK